MKNVDAIKKLARIECYASVNHELVSQVPSKLQTKKHNTQNAFKIQKLRYSAQQTTGLLSHSNHTFVCAILHDQASTLRARVLHDLAARLWATVLLDGAARLWAAVLLDGAAGLRTCNKSTKFKQYRKSREGCVYIPLFLMSTQPFW